MVMQAHANDGPVTTFGSHIATLGAELQSAGELKQFERVIELGQQLKQAEQVQQWYEQQMVVLAQLEREMEEAAKEKRFDDAKQKQEQIGRMYAKRNMSYEEAAKLKVY